MSKISLTDLANLQNETTAISSINSNNATLIDAIDNTLSRDGTLPNHMDASLDMNSNPILNLPQPTQLTSPLRLQDLDNFSSTGVLFGSPNVFDSIALAQAATISASASTVYTTGYYAAGDGGGATYTRDTVSTTGGFQSADGAWWKLTEAVLNVKMFGATGDGVTNDTSAIQTALTAAQFTTAGVWLPPGSYLVDPLTLPSEVILFGSGYTGRFSGSQDASARSTLIANSPGYIINSDSPGTNNSCINGVSFKGAGAAADQGGIDLAGGINSFWNAIRNCFFWDFANEAIVDHTTALNITDCLADSCLQNTTRADFTGVMTLRGTDSIVTGTEMSASEGSLSSTDMFICAYLISGGGDHFISNCVGEFADIGYVLLPATTMRITNCRADTHYAHGFYGGGLCQVDNCSAHNVSLETANTYSGFYTAGAQGGQFSNCQVRGTNYKYAFDDSTTSYGDPAQRCIFNGCRSFGHLTGVFAPAFFEDTSSFQVPNTIAYRGNGATWQGATPSVEGVQFLDLHGGGVTTITNFLNGVPLQDLYIIGDGNITIASNSNIFTNTGIAKRTQSDVLYHFKLFGGTWRELPEIPQITVAPTVISSTPVTLGPYTTAVIQNNGATATLTLIDPALYAGYQVWFKNVSGFAVDSASANVVPLNGGAAGTAILTAAVGNWVMAQADGTNWVIMAGN